MSLESSRWGGVHGLGSMKFGLAMQKFLNIEQIFHWKLNSQKFLRNWNVPLVLLRRLWWAGFNGILLVRFGFKMWEILIFEWFLPLKIQINSKNQVLEGKISWGRGNAWMSTIQFKKKELWCAFGVVGKILTIQI